MELIAVPSNLGPFGLPPPRAVKEGGGGWAGQPGLSS